MLKSYLSCETEQFVEYLRAACGTSINRMLFYDMGCGVCGFDNFERRPVPPSLVLSVWS